MANPRKRLPSNVSGDFFVDSTCINCDTCRQLAPKIFGESDGYSMVRVQPADARETRDAVRALLCCPTGSIGTEGPNQAKEVIDDFPLKLDDDVFYAGFNSAKSYGGNSYFVQHPQGNWLVDSPKYLPHLAKKVEALGGLKYIFLTHRDDVADARQYAQHFGAQRIIHRLDVSSQPDAEIVVDGTETIDFAPDFRIIPSPGHTAGHCVLLYKNRYLFTGDHLAWERDETRLDAWPDYAWYSWDLQLDSLKKLLDFEFEWVLPGHGDRIHLPKNEMHSQMQKLIEMFE
jgi:glyoxylase-like metal-dependent hydrolase (beta-lactamase superfamily II)/ferredoxin